MVMTIKRGADMEQIQSIIAKLVEAKKLKGINAYKYCGEIELKEPSHEIQKRLRSEWN